MKKNLMKKVFAVTLSVAMACSIIPATNPVTASAASSVKLNTKFKTLKIGAKYKLTLAKNTKNWKVVKATSKAPAIAKVYKTTSKAVKVKGKSEGRTNVIVKLKSGKTTKKLKCKFNVVEKSTPSTTPTPDPGPSEVKTEATVKNQAELDEALNDSNIKKITVEANEGNFKTEEKSYSDVELIVDAPNSDFENNAEFKSITIRAIKGETWTENGKNNTFTVLAKLVSMIIGKDAVVRNISFPTVDANIKLTVNGGEIGNISVSAKVALDIKGTAAKNIPITVTAGAKDAEISSEVPVDVETSANIKVNLSKGAEGSKVDIKAADVEVDLDNKTDADVVVTKHDGKTQTMKSGQSGKVTSPASSTVTPGVTPGTNLPVVGTNKLTNPHALPSLEDVCIKTGASIYITSGGSGVISGGSLSFTVQGVARQVSDAAIECKAVVKAGTSGRTDLGWQDCSYGSSATFNLSSFYGVSAGNNIEIKLSFRVKATDVYKAGVERAGGTYTITPSLDTNSSYYYGLTLKTDKWLTGTTDSAYATTSWMLNQN